MKHNNATFCISGFGRSGTKWLATLISKSKEWSVAHEPSNAMDIETVASRFANQALFHRYGEVNSYCMPILHNLPVDHVGVIIRDPVDILHSCICKGHIINDAFLDMLNAWLCMIDLAATTSRTCTVISFSRMTTDREYLLNALRKFDVTDVRPTEKDLNEKVNASIPDPKFLLQQDARTLSTRCQWFKDKYAEFL